MGLIEMGTMKTQQIMKREFFGKEIRQNHKTGFFCINDLTHVGNMYRENKGLPKAKWVKYRKAKKPQELFESLMKQEDTAEIFKTTRGKDGATWAHPLVFFDYAMWLSADFKIAVYKWLYDNLIEFRDNSGDSYKKMCGVLIETQGYTPSKGAIVIRDLARAIKRDVGVEDWNEATSDQLKLRDNIHNDMVFALDLGNSPVQSYKAVQRKHNLKKENF
jgi:hypothetical protein|tara:strand:- start:310 stop:963 length:654 start_codon:yes stop_codon:yes gene_type:complete